jgi:ribosomal protein S18 acetylase RimI-like enzyme
MPSLIPFSAEYQKAVLEFFTLCFPESNRAFEPNGRHQALQNICKNFMAFWLMIEDGRIIGTVGLRNLETNQSCELKCLYLYEEFHGLGYGRMLLYTALDYAKSAGFSWIYLDTRSDSLRAQKLYSAAGFQKTQPYYENPLTDVFFKLELSK